MSIFQFKHFSISQANTTMKVGTDAMLLGSIVSWEGEPQSILDIGTGTGVLALMLAQRTQTSKIYGIEIDKTAFQESCLNFQHSSWQKRLTPICADILEADFNLKFDLVVSNPPYYENSLLSDNERTSRAKHAEFLPVESLLIKVNSLLSQNGFFWVVIPSENATTWVDLASNVGLHLHVSVAIIGKEGQGEKRRVLAFGRAESHLQYDELTVRDENGAYTKTYIALTKEFHDRDLSH